MDLTQPIKAKCMPIRIDTFRLKTQMEIIGAQKPSCMNLDAFTSSLNRLEVIW